MPTLLKQKGALHSIDGEHNLGHTPLNSVLFDMFVMLNKTVVASGSTADYDAYSALVNHLEDLLSPMMTQQYHNALNREIRQISANLKLAKNYSEAELQDEAVKELSYLEARAKFRACCKLANEKLNFYPMREVVDII